MASPALLPRPHGAHEPLDTRDAHQNLDEALVPGSLLLPRLWLQAFSARGPSCAWVLSLVSLCPGGNRAPPPRGPQGLICGLLLPHQEWPAAPSSCTHSAPTVGSSPCSTSPGWRLTGTRPRKVRAQPPSPTPSPLGRSLLPTVNFLSVSATPFSLALTKGKAWSQPRGWSEVLKAPQRAPPRSSEELPFSQGFA